VLFHGIAEEVLDPLTVRLWQIPELKVLGPVVVADAVDVVNVLTGRERATKVVFHDGAMLAHHSAVAKLHSHVTLSTSAATSGSAPSDRVAEMLGTISESMATAVKPYGLVATSQLADCGCY
jgi:hypothetical protein